RRQDPSAAGNVFGRLTRGSISIRLCRNKRGGAVVTREPLPVAILAGGLATRLLPLTGAIPKALMDVNGEPFIVHQLRLLRRSGIERVVLCLAYIGDSIRDGGGDGPRFDRRVAA